MSQDVRAAAAAAIGEVIKGRTLDRVLPQQLDRVAPGDRGLLQQLCYGTLREGPKLQAILGRLLDRPLRERDAIDPALSGRHRDMDELLIIALVHDLGEPI